MADDTLIRADAALDGALERFERAEAELEETEARRLRLADEAARAASELEATLEQGIRTALEERDRLEEELAAVVDHITRLETIRTRSSGRADPSAAPESAPTIDLDREAPEPSGTSDEQTAAYEDKWYELMKSRDDDTAYTS
jgi:chromosome segregation ATPase